MTGWILALQKTSLFLIDFFHSRGVFVVSLEWRHLVDVVGVSLGAGVVLIDSGNNNVLSKLPYPRCILQGPAHAGQAELHTGML